MVQSLKKCSKTISLCGKLRPSFFLSEAYALRLLCLEVIEAQAAPFLSGFYGRKQNKKKKKRREYQYHEETLLGLVRVHSSFFLLLPLAITNFGNH